MSDLGDLPEAGDPVYDIEQLRRFNHALRNLVQARDPGAAQVGDPLDKFPTRRELVDAGLLTYEAGVFAGGAGSGSPSPGPPGPPGAPSPSPAPDLTPPPDLTGLTSVSLFAGAFLEWDEPTYTQGGGNGQTNIYAANYSGSGPLPTFADAVLVGSAVGNTTVYVDAAQLGVQRHYWAKFQTMAGVEQASPSGGINGVQVTIGKVGNSNLGLLIVEAGNLADGSVSAAKLAAQAVTLTAFASGIEPVSVVSSLPNPSGYTGPKAVVLTTDGKLYRYFGGAWVGTTQAADITGQLADSQLAALAASKVTGQLTNAQIADLAATKITGQLADAQLAAIASTKITGQLTNSQIADLATAKLTGQITTTQIASDAITTPKLAAGSVTTAKLLANAVTANEIAAGAITTAKLAAGAVTANEIAASTITAAQIAANAITATQLAAGSVTTAKLVANAVTANEIAAGAITTAKISAGAVTAAEIAAGAITTLKLAAGAVTANELAADSVIAGKIATGAIAASQIQAGAIRTNHLLITGAGAALNADPMAVDSTAWLIATGSPQFVTGITNIPGGGSTAVQNVSGASLRILSDAIPADSSKNYRMEAQFRLVSGASAACYFMIGWYDAAGAHLTSSTVNPAGWTNGTFSYGGLVNATPPSAWTKYTLSFGPNETAKIPATARIMRIGAILNDGATSGAVAQVTAIRLMEKAAADLIVDGSIIASKLAAGAIAVGSAAIQDGAIRNALIETAAITTAKIADLAVSDAKIASLNASKITAGFIDAARIAAGSIDATKINSNGLDIRTPGGTVILSSAQNLDWTRISGTAKPKAYRVASVGNGSSGSPIDGGLYDGESGALIISRGRSYILVRISRGTGSVAFAQDYDVYGNGDVTAGRNAATLAADLNATDAGNIVVLYTHDEPQTNRLTGGLPAAIYRCGGSPGKFESSTFAFRGAYMLIGIGGCGPGNAFYEGYAGSGTDTGVTGPDNAWLDTTFYVVNGNPIVSGAGLGGFQLNSTNVSTYIASAAIGTAQIADASITNAKVVDLHASKITAGSITADKIEALTVEAADDGLGAQASGGPLAPYMTAFTPLVLDTSSVVNRSSSTSKLFGRGQGNVYLKASASWGGGSWMQLKVHARIQLINRSNNTVVASSTWWYDEGEVFVRSQTAIRRSFALAKEFSGALAGVTQYGLRMEVYWALFNIEASGGAIYSDPLGYAAGGVSADIGLRENKV